MLAKAAANDCIDTIKDIEDTQERSKKVEGASQYISDLYNKTVKQSSAVERRDEFDKAIDEKNINNALAICDKFLDKFENDSD